MTAAVALHPIERAALDYLMCRIDLYEACREVRPWFPEHTPREIDAKLRLTATALLVNGVRP